MATALQNLQTAYNNVAANLAALTASPKPTYTIGQETYSWQELFDSYTNQMAVLKLQMQMEDLYEIRTTAT